MCYDRPRQILEELCAMTAHARSWYCCVLCHPTPGPGRVVCYDRPRQVLEELYYDRPRQVLEDLYYDRPRQVLEELCYERPRQVLDALCVMTAHARSWKSCVL